MTRPLAGTVEERSAPEALSVDGRRLHGVIPYGTRSADLGGFTEIMSPGCLRNADLSGLVARVDHAGLPVGRYPGTVALEDRDTGLHWSVELPRSRDDVREAVERGDLKSSSWRMVVARDRWEGDIRHVEEVRSLHDVSVVVNPAYPSAVAELRSAPEPEPEPEPEVPDESEAAVAEEETEVVEGGGGLTIANRNAPESRSGSSGDIETRVLEAIRSVKPGESRNLTTTSASPIDVPELALFVWDKLYPDSVMLSAGIKVISTSRESLLFPLVTTVVDPSWTPEATEIPEGDPGWTQVSVTPSKLAHRVIVSNEALDDAPLDLMGWIQAHVMRMMSLKLDAGLLEGHPTGGAPGTTGLKYTTGIQSIDVMGANGAKLTSLDPIAEAIAALEQVNARPSALVMAPEVWFQAETLKDSNSRYLLSPSQDPTQAPSRSLFGVPVYTSSQLSTNEPKGTASNTSSIYCFDSSQVVLVRRADVTLEVDRAQYFSSDQSQLRAKLRASMVIPNPLAVARVPGVVVS
jgi:HK97 family phage major capsid protein